MVRPQRHSNAIQRLGGGQPLRCAAGAFLWRSGALRSALDGLRLKIRDFLRTRFGRALFRPLSHRRTRQSSCGSHQRPSFVIKPATLCMHPVDTAREAARSTAARATSFSTICLPVKKIPAVAAAARCNGPCARRSRPRTAARVPARTLDDPHKDCGPTGEPPNATSHTKRPPTQEAPELTHPPRRQKNLQKWPRKSRPSPSRPTSTSSCR